MKESKEKNVASVQTNKDGVIVSKKIVEKKKPMASSTTNGFSYGVKPIRNETIAKQNSIGPKGYAFKNTIKLKPFNDIFGDGEMKSVPVKLPLDNITYLSLEYSTIKFFKAIYKKFPVITNLIKTKEGSVYAEVPSIKNTKMDSALPLLKSVILNVTAELELENIPSDVRPLLEIQKIFTTETGVPCLKLNLAKVIAAIVLPKFSKEIASVSNIMKNIQIGKVRFGKKTVNFPVLTPFEEETGLLIELDTKHISALNLSMDQSRFIQLAQEALEPLHREGSEISFVRTSSILTVKSKDLVISKEGVQTLRSPLIKLKALSDKSREDYNKIGIADEMDLFEKPVKIPGLATSVVTPNVKNVKGVYGDLFEGEPLFYKYKSTYSLCPNIKNLALITFFGSIRTGFSASVKTNPTQIAIAFETLV